MKQRTLYFSIVVLAFLNFTTSCTSSSSTGENYQEVTAMDSVSKELDETNKALDAEAKKVEASLEKVDKEFNAAK